MPDKTYLACTYFTIHGCFDHIILHLYILKRSGSTLSLNGSTEHQMRQKNLKFEPLVLIAHDILSKDNAEILHYHIYKKQCTDNSYQKPKITNTVSAEQSFIQALESFYTRYNHCLIIQTFPVRCSYTIILSQFLLFKA